MEIKNTLILDSSDSLSKALPQLDDMPAVIVTKNGKYYGIIDHGTLGYGMKEPQKVKCETASVKSPVLLQSAGLFERVDAFLVGHFKALPVLDNNQKPLGITTRVELLEDMLKQKVIPVMKVSEMMSSPVYTIGSDETVGAVKRVLKEKNARRLAVVQNGNVIGVISAYDIGAWAIRPNLLHGGRKDIRMSEQINMDDLKISSFLRPEITTVSGGATLEDAIKRMVEKKVSAVLVTEGKTPLGILSSVDIFRKIHELIQKPQLSIQISGLGMDDGAHYKHIEEKLGHLFEKFSKNMAIRNCTVHVKEGKSAYTLNLYLELDHGHLSFKSEREDLREAVDEVAEEISSVLRKKKEIQTEKRRD